MCSISQVDKNLSMTWNATFAAKFAVGIAKFLFYHYVLNIILYFMLFTGINADLELCNRLPLGTLCKSGFVWVGISNDSFFQIKLTSKNLA